MMLSAWCLVASGQWLVASAVLPTLGVRAPYVGGTLSLRWRGALGDRALPCEPVGADHRAARRWGELRRDRRLPSRGV